MSPEPSFEINTQDIPSTGVGVCAGCKAPMAIMQVELLEDGEVRLTSPWCHDCGCRSATTVKWSGDEWVAVGFDLDWRTRLKEETDE